eukprot:gene4972-2431_t
MQSLRPKKKKKEDAGEERNQRIAIVNPLKCKPKKCRQECKKGCPVVRMGKICIEVNPKDKIAFLSEILCIGCGICVKKCPPGQVLGLVGTNGIGKSTALKILAGKQKPNLGKFDAPPDWEDILEHFRGSELQNYFTRILEDDLKAMIKPQYVDNIPRAIKGSVKEILDRKADSEKGNRAHIMECLDLTNIMDRQIQDLSGGELQRFACSIVAVQQADVYMFDEPSSYLDVKQRLKAGRMIRE